MLIEASGILNNRTDGEELSEIERVSPDLKLTTYSIRLEAAIRVSSSHRTDGSIIAQRTRQDQVGNMTFGHPTASTSVYVPRRYMQFRTQH